MLILDVYTGLSILVSVVVVCLARLLVFLLVVVVAMVDVLLHFSVGRRSRRLIRLLLMMGCLVHDVAEAEATKLVCAATVAAAGTAVAAGKLHGGGDVPDLCQTVEMCFALTNFYKLTCFRGNIWHNFFSALVSVSSRDISWQI
jgi:hypothetical protein